MGACPIHGKYHSETEEMVCLTTRLCQHMKLEAACRRWRRGIQDNAKKWTASGARRIQKAGKEIYMALDELEIS